MFEQIHKLLMLCNILKNMTIKELVEIVCLQRHKTILINKSELLRLECKLQTMKAENYLASIQGKPLVHTDFSKIEEEIIEIQNTMQDYVEIYEDSTII